MIKNLESLSALELSKLIHEKKISPLELTTFFAERITKIDPQLHSFAHISIESALKEAQLKTEILGNTQDTSTLPLFFGIPTAIKDLYPVKGMPISYGNGFIKDQISDYDCGIVTKIKQAGFIIMGKTATSELGSLPYIESIGFPPSRNPYNLEYTSGGSSGGAAGAVAGGLIPIAPGSDGGGSVRGPAFCCGLVGLKPSRGRISNAPVGDYFGGIATHGCLSRTVADSAALLDVLSGYITGDPYWLPNPEISFLEAVTQNTGKLKIAYATEVLPTGKAHEILELQIKNTAHKLEAMGHILIEIIPDFTALVEPFVTVWRSSIIASGFPDQILSPMNQWLKEQSQDLGEYLRAVHQMQIISRQIVSLFADFDVLLMPTYLQPPIKVGAWANLSPQETLQQIIDWITPCPAFNATGQPAIAIPTGFTSDGVPIGVQLVAKPNDEATILQLAYQLENNF
ncbi:amidase [Geminocystis sp. NIES-3709]|uniref:amidase n=1 Tax=Geminocystis sp. NIES-3709 TaxID=1617448 RepID=UPI0005FC97E7|nr:amidase [Geminocystis sp. NIES-3709]BAQ66290.1 aspartyl-tRNA [Geminocystis sp. NIES-3709]